MNTKHQRIDCLRHVIRDYKENGVLFVYLIQKYLLIRISSSIATNYWPHLQAQAAHWALERAMLEV